MSGMFRGKGLSVFAFLALVAFSAPAYPAENATITGDKVNVRGQPAVWERIDGTLDKGARVEAAYVSDFTDTIDGFTAPWYYIKHGELWGYVFGRYVAPDPGTTVPPLPRGLSWYVDPIDRFIERGLHVFGENESAIVKTLGRPLSITKGRSEDDNAPGGYRLERRLTYHDAVIDIRRDIKSGPEDIHKLSLTTGAYEFDGLRVGSTIADVERFLGAPAERTAESLVYQDGTLGCHYLTFRTRDGVVIEIIFDFTYID